MRGGVGKELRLLELVRTEAKDLAGAESHVQVITYRHERFDAGVTRHQYVERGHRNLFWQQPGSPV